MVIRFAEKAPAVAPQKRSRKGVGGRPKKDNPKVQLSIRLDPDLLAHYRAFGSGWQSHLNEALRRAAGL